MKECPVCKSKVDEEFECPICWTTLTYEPECYGKGERYAFNKYYLRYLWRQCWFSLLCFVITVVMMCFVDFRWHPACVMPYVAGGISVLMGAFQRQLTKIAQWKYSADFAASGLVAGKYMVAVMAVLVAVMLLASQYL